MINKKVAFFFLLLLSYGISVVKAQNNFTVLGGNASGSGGSISYSVGQVVYTSIESSSGTINQGVQQSFDISIISEIENTQDINLTTYPNPTKNNLTLRIDNNEGKQYVASLFDINGKLLLKQAILNSETTIPMEQFSVSIYFLKILDGIKEIKTFKIIKL